MENKVADELPWEYEDFDPVLDDWIRRDAPIEGSPQP